MACDDEGIRLRNIRISKSGGSVPVVQCNAIHSNRVEVSRFHPNSSDHSVILRSWVFSFSFSSKWCERYYGGVFSISAIPFYPVSRCQSTPPCV